MHCVNLYQTNGLEMTISSSNMPTCGATKRLDDKMSCVSRSSPAAASAIPSTLVEDLRTAMLSQAERRPRENCVTVDLRSPARYLPRAEASPVETEVLTYRQLQRAGLCAPGVSRVSRSKTNKRIIAATVARPEGLPLSQTSWSISDSRRAQVKMQIELAQWLVTEQKSSSFGPICIVADGRGSSSWSLAFTVMFEALLEDGEDQFVNLPYNDIRKLIIRSKVALDRVTQARLVVPDFGRDANVLVDGNSGMVTGHFGFREAYWGDPMLTSPDVQLPVYRCYQAVKKLIVSHLRPTVSASSDTVMARAAMIAALDSAGPS